MPSGTFVNPAKMVHLFGLKEGSTFADFGCGSGAYVLTALPLVGQTGMVIALDVQKDLVLKVKQACVDGGYTNVRYIWGDFEQPGATNLPDGSLDVALISNTLFQLDDAAGALGEVHRTLKLNGRLFIIEWRGSFNGIGPAEGRVVDKARAQALLTQAGFSVVREFTPGEYHYGLECTK